MLTGLGNQSRHTLLGLHCVFCQKKQAKWDRRFRVRQFKSCWGLQSGTWVTGAEEYRGSFKEVYSEYVLFAMERVLTGEDVLSLKKAISPISKASGVTIPEIQKMNSSVKLECQDNFLF